LWSVSIPAGRAISMFDPGTLAFLPWLATVAGAVAAPAFLLVRQLRRLRGARRNASTRCARCDQPFPDYMNMYLFEGRYVCGHCAGTMRSRLKRLFLFAGVVALSAAVLGIGGMVVDGLGTGFGWWAWHRVLIVIAPPVVVGWTARRSLLRLQRSNRLEQLDSESNPQSFPSPDHAAI
jgi:hypothetical protein